MMTGHLHAQGSASQKKFSGRKIQKQNLGTTVNSVASELSPIISSDGRLLYFTMGAGHPESIDRVPLEVEFDEHNRLFPHNPAVMTRLNRDSGVVRL